MRGAQIVVCESFNSNVTFIYKGKKMKYKTFRKKEKQLSPQDVKTLNRIATLDTNTLLMFFQTVVNKLRK